MGADKNIIAIELGSSSIRGIMGQRKADGGLQVVSYEKEITPDCVRKGVIYNLDKTTQAILNIVKHFEDRHKVYINKVYIGVSGQSLRTVGNCVSRQFDVKVEIKDEIVDSLMEMNRGQSYPDAEILDVAPQEYRIGNNTINEPVGIMTDRIEGYYMNVIARKVLCDNIRRCLQNAKIEMADTFISPLLLSGYLLSASEKRSGCALVDFGADTTTVAIYEKDILRHLVVIPLGGNNITVDIATSQHMEFEEAEALKLKYGTAYTDEEEGGDNQTIDISNDRKLPLKTLLNIIEARQQEIIENAWHQISPFADRLLAGVVITGGASNMPEMEAAFAHYTRFSRVKTRLMPSAPEFTTTLRIDYQNNTLATLIAMLRRGEQECTSDKPLEPTLFEDEHQQESAVTTSTASVAGQGVVKTSTPPVEELPHVPEPEPEPKPEPKPKSPGLFKQVWSKFKDTLEGLVEEQ